MAAINLDLNKLANARKRTIVSALGTNPAFKIPEASTYTPKLGQDYGFPELANYEEQRRTALGPSFQKQIGDLQSKISSSYDEALNRYKSDVATRRNALASSLSDTAQKTFQMNNPYILEDLHSRGLFTSPTAVAQAQTQAQKELALESANQLNEFDTLANQQQDALAQEKLRQLNELYGQSTAAGMQTQQDALDAALQIRRGGLENKLSESQASREEQLARDLAKQQGRNSLTGALIGAGGSLLGSGLGQGGFLSSLFSSGGGAAGAGGAAGTGGATGASGAAGTPIIAPIAGAAAGTAAYEGIRKTLAGQGVNKTIAKGLGSVPLVGAQVAAVNKVLGTGAGKTGTNVGNQQRAMNEMFDEANQLNTAYQQGNLDDASYASALRDNINKAILHYHQTASLGQKAANNIRQNFHQYLTAGLVRQTGPDSYESVV